MGYNDDGFALCGQGVQRFFYETFGNGVERRGGLIEDKHFGLLVQGARDGNALPFATRKRGALFAYDGV